MLWAVVVTNAALIGSLLVGTSLSAWWATIQSLTPYAIIALAPVGVIALRRGRPAAAATSSGVGLIGLAVLVPVVFPAAPPAAADGAYELRVGAVNLLYGNQRVSDVAAQVEALDLDAVVFVEYTAEHRDTLLATDLVQRFAHRFDGVAGEASGLAIWSRAPMLASTFLPTKNRSADVTIETPSGPVRIVGVHPPTPVNSYADWLADLGRLADLVDDRDEPLLMIGDFNATYWHPPFRAILDAGLTSAHVALGRGFATSWPTDKVVPPFVRLDHALVGNGLTVTAVEDLDTIGSDHAAVVVTVVPAR